MSALQASPGNKAVDQKSAIIELVEKVQPHLSHIVTMAKLKPILDSGGNPTTAIYAQLDRVYVMTTKGLANRVRPFFFCKSKPRLMNDESIELIEGVSRVRVIKALELLLKSHEGSFGRPWPELLV